MKTLKTAPASLLCIIMLFVYTSSYAQWGRNKTVKGNGNVTTETRVVSDFDEIKVSMGMNVVFKQGPKSVVVKADENLQDYIITEVNGNTLTIKRKSNLQFKNYNSIEIRVSTPDIFVIETSSGADFETIGTITTSHLRLTSSSGSNLEASVKAEKMKVESSSGSDLDLTASFDMMEVNSSSGSDIDIQGTGRSVKLSASSGSDIDAKDLSVKNCDADASSAGSVSISVSDNLVAKASSGGDIDYYGNPSTDKSTSSGGDISKH